MQDIETLEQKFGEGQAELIEKFKAKLKNACDDVLSGFYCDMTNYATTDAYTNYHNFLRDEFKESLTKEIAEEYGHYSWAHGIRMALLQKHPDVLRNKIIDDLQARVKSLEEHLEQLRNRY